MTETKTRAMDLKPGMKVKIFSMNDMWTVNNCDDDDVILQNEHGALVTCDYKQLVPYGVSKQEILDVLYECDAIDRKSLNLLKSRLEEEGLICECSP